LFYPETREEQLAMLRAMQRKTGTSLPPEAEALFLDRSGELSGADVEAVLTRARMKSALANDAAVTLDDLKSALDDFIPPSYPTEIEMQNLAAVLECTSRSLLPAKYKDIDRAEVIRLWRAL
jgi:SpoVK/Ycf46/Vps4 family AAA+-type ATPase